MSSTAAELLYAQALTRLEGVQDARILAINAAPHAGLRAIGDGHRLTVQQAFRPDWLDLQRLGLEPLARLEEIDADPLFDLALVLPGKQREASLGMLAAAMRHLAPDGTLIAACANAMGGKAYEKRLNDLAGNVTGSAKSHCRLFRAQRTDAFDEALAEAWVHEAAARMVPAHGLVARPGNFSWEAADSGSELLRRYLENRPLAGRGMDLCCGYGYLASRILAAHPDVSELHLVDADRDALDCAVANTEGARVAVHARWLDATVESLPGGLDWIVLNPPFHRGQDVDTALGQAIAAAACKSLKPGGRLAMVANRPLPYEQRCRELLTSCDVAEQSAGFKILEGVR